jgi:ParB-like chromosome segregation protein Spo0J
MTKQKQPADATKPRAIISTIPVWCRFDDAADVESLVPNPRNPNTHGDSQIALLAKIIRANGWRAPITISNRSGFIVKGHGRLQAARLLQVAQVPVERQDYANEAEEWQDMIADNRIAELAEINSAVLKDMLQELDTGANDMDLTGFDAGELERLMTQYHVGEGEKLADKLQSEPEWQEEHDQAEKRVDSIAEKLKQLKNQKPESLNKARAIVLASGNNQILIIDETLPDVLTELQRYVDAGEDSPLARMLNAVHKL